MSQTIKRSFFFICILFSATALSACGNAREQKDYGVFLTETDVDKSMRDYDLMVIDAQYFSREDISYIKADGTTVYSYINIGSLEPFRAYFEDFKDGTLGKYEHWDEYWEDVSDPEWQRFITGQLAPSLLAKGIDGFFVDNCDVYYEYSDEAVLEGLATIMKGLVATGKDVIINGGDCFLDAYCEKYGSWSDVITGINQESVFSAVDWESGRFKAAGEEDREYFTDYIERYASYGADIYLLEYTTDRKLISEIDGYCREHGFKYYVSDSVELDL